MLTATDVQRWTWKLVRVTIAAFLGVACFGIAMPWIGEQLQKRRGATPGNPIEKGDLTVVLDLHQPEAIGTVQLVLGRADVVRIEREISAPVNRAQWQRAIEGYVPRISIGDDVLDYSRISFDLPERASTGSVSLRFSPLTLNELHRRLDVKIHAPRQIRSKRMHVTVLTHGMPLAARSVAPTMQSAATAVFDLGAGSLELVLLRTGAAEARDARISDVVKTFDAKYQRVVQPLVAALMNCIPFALLLALLRRYQLPAESFRMVAVSLIALFLGLGLSNAATDLYFSPLKTFESYVHERCWELFTNPAAAAGLGAAFVAFYWPAFTRRERKGRVATASANARIVFWVATLACASVAVALVIRSCRGTVAQEAIAFAAAGGIFGLAAAAAEFASARRALVEAALLGGVALLLDWVDRRFEPPNAAAYALVALATVPLLFSLARLLAPGLRGITRLGLAIGTAAVLVLGPLPEHSFWWQATVSSVAGKLVPALRLLAAVFLVRILRDTSRAGDWAVLEEAERDAGIVLALTYFFMPSHQWLSVIVTFAVGWLLLRTWVFVPRRITAHADVPATIRDVIRLNEAELALRAMKKAMRAKLATGEVDFAEYELKVRGMEATVDELRAKVQPSGDAAPAAVLSSGNAMAPWERAMVGARYGLLFAIPWLALFLRDFHAGTAPNRAYEWLDAIGSTMHAMAQWPLLGFFFGYFYSHLRGESGVSKGGYLFLAVVTPALAATTLATPTSTAAWISFSFWALQLLIHCILLGFIAGDYETLRASGLGWRHVVDVHNLGAMAAWGSTLLLAIGAAATTAATTQAGALIMQALQTVVPELRPGAGPGPR